MRYDLTIIGAGPAGYVAALRAGQLGIKTLLIDKKYIGGMCLNWGCIPTKTYLESIKVFEKIKNAKKFGITGIDKNRIKFDWQLARKKANKVVKKLTKGVEFLLKKRGVEILIGEAKIIGKHQIEVSDRVIETDDIIIATGSKPPQTKLFPKDTIIELENFVNLADLPKKPVIFGNGPVAIELTQFLSKAGKEVLLISNEERLLPDLSKYMENFIRKIFKKDKINFITNDKWHLDKNIIHYGDKKFSFDKVINAQRRMGIIPDRKIDIKAKNGFLETNRYLQTNYENVYAVGDINGRSYLAHAASAQGLLAVNHIKGIREAIDLQQYPINIYTLPEMAQIGKTEQELEDMSLDFKVNEFSLRANGKALAAGENEGSIRILSEKSYGEIMGVQIISANATDMISEASAIMQMEGTIFDLAKTIHAHPTVSEVFMEAGMDAVDLPLHK